MLDLITKLLVPFFPIQILCVDGIIYSYSITIQLDISKATCVCFLWLL